MGTNRVILTEKPSVAAELAKVLGANQKMNGYFQGVDMYENRICVTWCFGHLLELSAREAEGPWRIENLPIDPERFTLVPVRDEVAESQKKGEDNKPASEYRLEVIRFLFNWSNEIVAATDAGREGQSIFENVYNYLGIRRDVLRFWASSLTEQAILEAYANMKDNREYVNPALAAWERSVSDWRVGINATRGLTLATNYHDVFGRKKVLSIGRVQTVTLCMICERFEEYKKFKPVPFWYLEGNSVKDGVTFKWRGVDRYDKEDDARKTKDVVVGDLFLKVKKVTTERKTEMPPLLHDIASLQKMANQRYSYTMEETLAAAQTLYESKLITYPRTGSRYVPDDVFETVPNLLKSLFNDNTYKYISRNMYDNKEKLCRRSVDAEQVTDHHGLIITGHHPNRELTEVQKNVYELIVLRFLEAFSSPCVADITDVELESNGIVFQTRGRLEVSHGWRAISKTENKNDVELDDVDKIEMAMTPLPVMREGEVLPIAAMKVIEDKTKPRPLLTDATLLSMMENAGKRSDNKQVASVLKETGIGTPATRHEVMQILIKREYVVRKKKSLVPTDVGLEVYHIVYDQEIANVELTAQWECVYQAIADGKLTMQQVAQFEDNVKQFASRAMKQLINCEGVKKVREKMEAAVLTCPRCKHPIILTEKTAWCKNCTYTIFRTVAGKRLDDSSLRQLIKQGYTSVLKGFKNKKGKEFNASVVRGECNDRGWVDLSLQIEKKK